jgi:hypothetical protein
MNGAYMELQETHQTLGKPVFGFEKTPTYTPIQVVNPQVITDLHLQVVFLTNKVDQLQNEMNSIKSNKLIRFILWVGKLFG